MNWHNFTTHLAAYPVKQRVAVASLMCASLIGMIIHSPSAFGEKIYYPEVAFGEPGSEPGKLKEPVGVAVDDKTGDVYVADSANRRVEYFSKDGSFVGEFNGSGALPNEGKAAGSGHGSEEVETGQFEHPEQIAIDNDSTSSSYGDVYVADAWPESTPNPLNEHNVIDKFSATGEYLGQVIGQPGRARFDDLRGVAVDASGNLWVYGGVEEPEGSWVFEFDSEGKLERTFSSQAAPHEGHAIAVEPHGDLYLVNGLAKEVEPYTQSGGSIASCVYRDKNNDCWTGVKALSVTPSTTETTANGLAGNLLMDMGSGIVRCPEGTSRESCVQPLETFPTEEDLSSAFMGLSESYGLAVGASGTVFASERGLGKVQTFDYVSAPAVVTRGASKASTVEITVQGTVNPEGETITRCEFETGDQFGVYNEGMIPCEQSISAISGEEPVLVSATVPLTERMLETGALSYRLVASDSLGVSRAGAGRALSKPGVSGEAIVGVGLSGATAVAQLDTGGLETCYVVEYCAGEPVQGCVPGSSEPTGVSAALSGLAVGARCQFRIVAHNALGVVSGGELAFATLSPTTAELPDGRVAELVSPTGVGRATEVYVPHGLVSVGLDLKEEHGIYAGERLQAAPDGEEVAYAGDPPAVGGNGSFGESGGNQYVAKRSTGGGWTAADVSATSYGTEYEAFSEGLSVGVLRSGEALASDAPFGYRNLYRRAIGWRPEAGGSFGSASGPFEPLITEPPACPTRYFGSTENGQLSIVTFGGGDAAFGHLLFEANAALTATPVPPWLPGYGAECAPANYLYDWSGGQLYLVSVLPNGTGLLPEKVEAPVRKEETVTGGMFGRRGPSAEGYNSPDTSEVVSEAGTRVYWSTMERVPVGGKYGEEPTGLFVRENDTRPQSEVEEGKCVEPAMACTLQVNVPEAGVVQAASCEEENRHKEIEDVCEHPAFWTASGDGSRVFFTDESRLTKGASAGRGDPDLYEYDLEAPEGMRLRDLSPAPAGGHADVDGVVGASSDGSYVYFVAGGVLEAEGATGLREGEPHLYLAHGGRVTFIATLSPQDEDFAKGEGYGDWQADPGHRTAYVTPDGGSVAFTSRQRLTPYDNEVEVEGESGGTERVALTEVYVYNAGSGRLVCASCAPDGEAPTDEIYAEFAKDLTDALGSFLPADESIVGYQPRVVSSNGRRVFFDSIEPLTQGSGHGVVKGNGFLNVFEWEAPGEGSCTVGGASPVTGGCTFLLSGGQSSDNSYLIDASADGSDVFFVSREQLGEKNRVGYDELFDARVGGVESLQPVVCRLVCQGEPVASPSFATPASASFQGSGNPVPTQPSPVACPRHKKLVGGKCVEVKAKRKKVKHKKGGHRAKRGHGVKRSGKRARNGRVLRAVRG